MDQSLKDTLLRFSREERFTYWSGYVRSLAVHTAQTEGSSCTFSLEYQMLVSAWRMLLIIATSHVRPWAEAGVGAGAPGLNQGCLHENSQLEACWMR